MRIRVSCPDVWCKCVAMRTQLILESWQYDSLKSIAEERETSLSSLVREAVTRYLSVRRGEARLEDLRSLGSDAREAARGTTSTSMANAPYGQRPGVASRHAHSRNAFRREGRVDSLPRPPGQALQLHGLHVVRGDAPPCDPGGRRRRRRLSAGGFRLRAVRVEPGQRGATSVPRRHTDRRCAVCRCTRRSRRPV